MRSDDVLKAVEEQPRFRVTVDLLLDASAFSEAQELNRLLAQMVAVPVDDDITVDGAATIAKRLAELAVEHPPVSFVFEARTAREWSNLCLRHPSPDAEVAPSFWPALLAESCVEPAGFTEEQFATLEDRLTSGQWEALLVAIRDLNRSVFDLNPTSAVSALARASA